MIPPMALGTMYFGTQVPRNQAFACLNHAYELGARFWDTANNYAFWANGTGNESEETIGAWLAANGTGMRDEVTLATKIGARPRSLGDGLDASMGLSRRAIRTQVQDSLRRLDVDHVDVLYTHIDDANTALEETLDALSQLVDEGLTRTIASSNLTAARLTEALETPSAHPYTALQQRFSYLEPAPSTDLSPHVLLDDEVSSLCSELNLTRLGYSPLLSGAYTRADRPLPEGYEMGPAASAALTEIGNKYRLDRGQVVLSWMVRRREKVISVVGVSTPEQVQSAWEAVTTTLNSSDVEWLERARHE